jgi:Amt family ammonium transporter
VVVGASILWFGWFGFNAGSALAAGGLASNAFTVTHLATAAAAWTWTLFSWFVSGKPSVVGAAAGAVAGLVAITPASGFVTPMGAIAIGIGAGALCYFAVRLRAKIGLDDSLDVVGVHGVGGVVGVLSLGVFAYKAMNPDGGADGLVHGNAAFFFKEAGAVIGAALYAFVFTYGMLAVINKITPVKVTAADEELGLDESLHGERAYL